MDDLTVKLLAVLRPHLRFLGEADELRPADELSDLGLDSTAAIGLLLDLERAFAISCTDELLVPVTFRTPRAIRDAIATLQRRHPAPG